MLSNSYFLESNLREIYAALQATSSENHLPLHATRAGYVYYSGSWMGRFWHYCDKTWYEGTPLSVIESVQTILTTQFELAVQQVKMAIDKRFEARTTKNVLTINEERIHRECIVRFFLATESFWALLTSSLPEDIQKCSPILHLLSPSAALLNKNLLISFQREAKWIELESIMQKLIPFALISRIHQVSNFKEEEHTALSTWVKSLCKHQQSIPASLLSTVLHEIIRSIHAQDENSPVSLMIILDWLDRQGCSLLHREDPLHLDWREALAPGKKIVCNGIEFELEEQLSPKKLLGDNNKIFSLKNHPDWVVKIAHNCLILLIEEEKKKHSHTHFGIRTGETIHHIEQNAKDAPIDGLDALGRCVIVEKLSPFPENNQWQSHTKQLDAHDELPALALANHLYCMMAMESTAENLSPSHLMQNSKGVIKSSRLLKRGEENYLTLERYCVDLARENKSILSFLIYVSKLKEHPVASYIQSAVSQTLQTGKTDIIGRPLPLNHRRDIYAHAVEKLCEEAKEIRSHTIASVVAHLRQKNAYSSENETAVTALEKKVANALVRLYKLSPIPGLLTSDLSEKAVQAILYPDTETNEFLEPEIVAYYQKQHKQMLRYNELASPTA